MTSAIKCPKCDATLGGAVAFCPFCGEKSVDPTPPTPPPSGNKGKSGSKPADDKLGQKEAEGENVPPAPPQPPIDGKGDCEEPSTEPKKGDLPEPSGKNDPAKNDKVTDNGQWVRLILIAAVAIIVLAIFGQRWISPSKPRNGTMIVSVHMSDGGAPVGGTVLVNNTPAGGPGTLLTEPEGPLTVGYSGNGLSAVAKQVTIQADGPQPLRVEIEASALLASLSVVTTPPGAAIRIDQQEVGTSPLTVSLKEGQHTVVTHLSGFVGKTSLLHLERGQAKDLDLDLTPITQTGSNGSRAVLLVSAQLHAEPSLNSEVLSTIAAGQEVPETAQVAVEGQIWRVLRDSSGRIGYLPPSAVLKPLTEHPISTAPIVGNIDRLMSDRLIVNGQPLLLHGIRPPRDQLVPQAMETYQNILTKLGQSLQGQPVECELQADAHYSCFTNKRDIAEFYLLNGAAMTSDDASSGYVDMQNKAVEKRKGMWSQL
jgi:hypothetical protein